MGKTNEAKYSFKFVSDVYELARAKHIKPGTFSIDERRNARGHYDYVTVTFLVPRPDRDKPVEKKFDLEAEIAELEADLNTDEESEKEEVNSNEI